MFTLRDLTRNLYSSQHVLIHIMGGEEYYITVANLRCLNPVYFDFTVRTIEIQRDENGMLTDILRIIISKP